MPSDYQHPQQSYQSYGGAPGQQYPGFPPGGWQQVPPTQPKKKHRALKVTGGAVAGLVILVIIISASNGGGSGPTTATQPGAAPSASHAARSVDAACQLLPATESQIKAGNYDTAQRDAQHAEDLASKEGSLSSVSETGDFGQLAMDLINIDGIDKSTVNADLATVTDDCK
jgi:hypothetical protein